ncbi:leucyl/phenylalanyl-tRNA--protein transferase [Pseudoalteromonas denitrificans]|uniref:Leucyl/phenylalanyl-tRNA--protein transferase n=1 Tax=Pseudoalteromonas denitrificans DSM 6059 TaxID=1123010 RepID=A0A1I1RWG7_9GAMM|nr:leucyl/phenylalanyl-tRNA--protein transferase [Pseudoalteromonas denitrificans]SFD38689.1 leucyl/phenylalanyl-tRNA--protein transferase [Pseudoalteromonas denitrificans DSM 6059]
MSKQVYQLGPVEYGFPSPELALDEPDGLLAFGGDLSNQRLKLAYQSGIFPWFSEDEPIMWWSPSIRAVINLSNFHISKSLKKYQKKNNFIVKINTQFESVIDSCQQQRVNQEGTWITPSMKQAYMSLHQTGLAHSVEVYHNNKIVGGLYGIMQSGVFCGESMFHTMTNASKLACWALVNWLQRHNAHFIDCQLTNPYLTSLGASELTRQEFLTKLKLAQKYKMPENMWQSQELDNIYE